MGYHLLLRAMWGVDMTLVLAFLLALAALIAAWCAADAIAGWVLRSQRFAEWFGWWTSVAEHDEWRRAARDATRKRIEPLP